MSPLRKAWRSFKYLRNVDRIEQYEREERRGADRAYNVCGKCSLNLECVDFIELLLQLFLYACNPSKYRIGGVNERFALFSFLHLKPFFWGGGVGESIELGSETCRVCPLPFLTSLAARAAPKYCVQTKKLSSLPAQPVPELALLKWGSTGNSLPLSQL